MRRLVLKGYNTTLFTAEFEDCLSTETIDSVNVIRSGSKYKVYGKALEYYKNHKDDYDLVIDEINTRPFLTPKFVKNNKPIIAIFHKMAKEVWF